MAIVKLKISKASVGILEIKKIVMQSEGFNVLANNTLPVVNACFVRLLEDERSQLVNCSMRRKEKMLGISI